jgi:hypothetical protein
MMDKCLSETCWADLEDQYTLLFVASSWFWFYYIAYIEDARSNTNETIISLYSINLSVYITEAESVYCAVRTESLSATDPVSPLKG